MSIFTPNDALPYMMVAIDGKILISPFPFTSFSQLAGLSFSASARQVVFQNCIQSVQRNRDGTLSIINPIAIVVIQDGVSPAGYWDGGTARHLDASSPALETPQGLWMAWTGQRLWIANGTRIFASDLANPLSSQENTYLAQQSSFELGEACTGLIQASSEKGLLAFTENTVTAFQSYIYNRVTWDQTPGFQTLLVPSVGCIAGKSIFNAYGLTHWLSKSGLITLDAALTTARTSEIYTIDGEMTRSKRNLAGDKSLSCGIDFENMVLLSVPSADKHNSHTWIRDGAVVGQAGNGVGEIWAGVWTGVRPVQWAKTSISGQDRLYFVSVDYTAIGETYIHAWEAFHSSRQDNYGDIACQVETKMIVENGKRNRFMFAELDLTEIVGNVSIQAYYRGFRGPWVKCLDTVISATEGSIYSGMLLDNSTILQSYAPQDRCLRTEEIQPQNQTLTPESSDKSGVDKGAGLLIQWRGRMGIKGIRMIIENQVEFKTGDPVPSAKSEFGKSNIVLENGSVLV
jgi:hypothetical protein